MEEVGQVGGIRLMRDGGINLVYFIACVVLLAFLLCSFGCM